MFGTVLITCPPDRAEEIARILVEEKLAACVNVLPKVTSFYRWEGKTNKDEEALLIAKTRLDILEIVKRRLRELHPYEVPRDDRVTYRHGTSGILGVAGQRDKERIIVCLNGRTHWRLQRSCELYLIRILLEQFDLRYRIKVMRLLTFVFHRLYLLAQPIFQFVKLQISDSADLGSCLFVSC